MMMPGRTYTAGSGYRYGFNGKENDNEVKGEGNQQDYGMRIYDTRLGKFLSVDPIAKDYPWNSVYAYAENEPISNIDLDGLEKVKSTVSPVSAGVQQYTDEKKGQAKGIMRFITSTEPYRNLWGYAKDWGKAVTGDKEAIHQVNVKTTKAITNTSMAVAHGISDPAVFVSTMHNRPVNQNIQGLTFYGLKALELYGFSRLNQVLDEGGGAPNYLKSDGNKSYSPSTFLERLPEKDFMAYHYDNVYIGYFERVKGVVTIDLNIPKQYQSMGLGSTIFKEAVEGQSTFQALWVKSTTYETGASINLLRYQNAIKSGLTTEQAAWETWSGQQAKAAGFKNVSVKTVKDGVQATFTR